MPDLYVGNAISPTGPLIGAFVVSPSDTVDLPQTTRQIRVTGAAGTITAIWQDGQTRTIPVQTNDVLDWRLVRVLATGTTAAGVWGFY